MNWSVIYLALAILSPSLCWTEIVTENDRPLVETEEGAVQGITELSRGNREYLSFLGIRYGVFSRRFEPAKPEISWAPEIRDGSEFGAECSQTEFAPGHKVLAHSEDCLFLNVYIPKHLINNASEPLPVMVWIHGGGFVDGAGSQYGADYFMDEDVILVTLNYRLGILGFLNTGDGVIPGNNGLRDQILALKWVRRNIGHFQGNPDRVTIFGESAGGASVHALTLSPLAKGLFQGAIIQSASLLCPWAYTPSYARWAVIVAQKLDCPFSPTEEMVECFRQRPLEDLLEVQKDLTFRYPDFFHLRFNPTIDSVPKGVTPNPEDQVLPAHPYELITGGYAHDIPVLIGRTEAEGYLFFVATYLINEKLTGELNENWLQMAPERFYYEDIVIAKKEAAFGKRLKDIYVGTKNFSLDTEDAFVELHSQFYFDRGIRLSAELLAQTNPNVYPFVLTHKGQYSIINLMGLYGRAPTHSDDLQHLFNSVKKKNWSDLHHEWDVDFSKKFVKLWASFAKNGKPEDVFGLEWRPAEKGQPLEEPLPWYAIDQKPKYFQESKETEERYVQMDSLYAAYELPRVSWRNLDRVRDEL